MTGRGRADDGDVADGEGAGAVHGGERRDVVRRGDLRADVAQRAEGAGVGGVLQARHALAPVVVADPPHEHRHAARGGVVERPHHLVHVERGVADVDQAQHVHGSHPSGVG